MDVDYEFINNKPLMEKRLTAHTDQDSFKAFLGNLNTFRLNKQLCDVELECQGEIIRAHKVVLAASIDYFRGLYNFGMVDAQQNRISINEVSSNGLKQIVEFAYTYECSINEENVRELLQASNYLGVKFVKDGCEVFLIELITAENCLEFRELADQHSCYELLSAINAFLLEHFMEFCNSPEFMEINSIPTLERLVQSDDLSIDDEKYLFEFIIKWIEVSREQRIEHLSRLLRHVRFFQLPLAFFLGTVRQHPLIMESPEAQALIRSQTEAFLSVVSVTASGKIGAMALQHRTHNRKAPEGGSPQNSPRNYASAQSASRDASSTPTGNGTAVTIVDLLEPHQMVALLKQSEELALQARPRKIYAGVIFCVGGRGPKLDPFRSVEVYDWLHDTWRQIGQLRIGRRHVGVICVGPRIYAIGGHDGTEHLSSVECLNVTDESWREVAPLNVRRRGMAVGALGNAIYAIGGLDDQNCYKTVERYDIELNQWSQVADMNVPRGGVAVATFENQLYAIGGNSGTSSLESCERYDPILDKWTHISPMRNRRAGAGVAVIDPYLYVIGGFDDDSPLSTCERYSFAEDSWTEIPSLSCPRGGVGVTAMGSQIFAIGGHDSRNYLNTVEAFDPVTGKWKDVAPINQRRAGAGVAWSPCSIKDITFSSGIKM